MRAGAGKSKGSAFEREVCKQLSLWLSHGERSDLLWRSSLSGGRATVLYRTGKIAAAQAGDISSIDKLSHNFSELFYVECKFYKILHLRDMLYDRQSGLPDFWKVAVEESDKYNKLPMMIAKQNRYATMLCVDRDAVNLFFGTLSVMKNKMCRAYFPRYNMFVFLFDEFLKATDPKALDDYG